MSNVEVTNDLKKMKESIQHTFTTNNFNVDDIKRWVMYWYYERDGRLPEPFLFKRVSGSLYYYLRQKYPKNKINTTIESQ